MMAAEQKPVDQAGMHERMMARFCGLRILPKYLQRLVFIQLKRAPLAGDWPCACDDPGARH
jgi:hypothetical protein